MAKYKKRKDGRYSTSVTVGYKLDGKPIKKVVYGKSSKEVDDKRIELVGQIKRGMFILDESITFGDWAVEWLDTYKGNVQHNTRLMYEIMINTHILPCLGNMKLKDVRPQHIQRIVNEKIENGMVRTAEKVLLTIKQIFKRAAENNLVIKNPAEVVELPRKEKTKKRALTEIEKGYIENADLDLKSRAFLYVLLYAGLRKGEGLALMKKDVNLREKTITVDKTLITIGNRPEIKPSPKTEAGNRTIPMPDVLLKVLTEHLSCVDTLYLFPAVSGEIMSKIAFRRFWEKIIKRLNVAAGGNDNFFALAKDVTPHIFRHTYATMLYYSGVDIKTAQYLLGHSTINVTMEIYTHLDKTKTKSAAEKLNELIAGSQAVVSEEKR